MVSSLMIEAFTLRVLAGQARLMKVDVDGPCKHRDHYIELAFSLVEGGDSHKLRKLGTMDAEDLRLAFSKAIATLCPDTYAQNPPIAVENRGRTPWLRCEAVTPFNNDQKPFTDTPCRPLMDDGVLQGCSRCGTVSYCGPGSSLPPFSLTSLSLIPSP